MTDFLIMLGLVTLTAWGYFAVALVSYALLFRKALSGDRLFLSVIWPASVPAAVLFWARLRLRRSKLPKAQVRR